jgi:hypothetical protein
VDIPRLIRAFQRRAISPPPEVEGEIRCAAGAWEPRWVAALSDPDPQRRADVIRLLASNWRHVRIDHLCLCLGEENPLLVDSAARVLLEMGAHAVPELSRRLRDRNGLVRYRSVLLLCAIGPAAIPPIRTLLQACDPWDSVAAADALRAIADRNPIPELRSAMTALSKRRFEGAFGGFAGPSLSLAYDRLEELFGPLSDLPIPAHEASSAGGDLPVVEG